jgi:hypothetical protein
MKLASRYVVLAIASIVFGIAATLFTAGVGAQEEGWQIQRADYGFKNQRSDVSDILKDLIERGGVNGRVAVNNQTMGGDPAVGRDKSLRIFARNRRNEEREFNYKEGGFVEARMFTVRQDDRDDHPANYGDHDRDARPAHYGDRDREDWNSLKIIGGYYGVQGRTVNVTDVLRSRIREGVLSFVVTNSALGGDPAVGADKILIVVYRYQGKESATAVREGYSVTIP